MTFPWSLITDSPDWRTRVAFTCNVCGHNLLCHQSACLYRRHFTWGTMLIAPSSDKPPAGLRVLVVDDDLISLAIMEKMLKRCLYEVTVCNSAVSAFFMLLENKNAYHMVISEANLPDMDGFELLERVSFEIDLPIIMMSADDSSDVIEDGMLHGACEVLTKPVRMNELRNIWQHVKNA